MRASKWNVGPWRGHRRLRAWLRVAHPSLPLDCMLSEQLTNPRPWRRPMSDVDDFVAEIAPDWSRNYGPGWKKVRFTPLLGGTSRSSLWREAGDEDRSVPRIVSEVDSSVGRFEPPHPVAQPRRR